MLNLCGIMYGTISQGYRILLIMLVHLWSYRILKGHSNKMVLGSLLCSLWFHFAPGLVLAHLPSLPICEAGEKILSVNVKTLERLQNF